MKITSANPQHTNEVFAGSAEINPADFDRIIEAEINKAIAQSAEFKPVAEKVNQYSTGNVEAINNLSSKHFGNLQSIARGPFAFVQMVLTKQLVKAAAGVGLALIIMQLINFAIDESMKPGRILDRRFKRLAANEVLLFWTHQEQEKLKRGFTEVRVTTQSGLRGGASQVNGNLFTHQVVSGTLGAPTEYKQDAQVEEKPFTGIYGMVDEFGNPTMPRRIR